MFFFLFSCSPFPESSSISVPWFHQLDIPDVGWAACSSASAAMVLAYHGYIPNDNQSMVLAAQDLFASTSDPQLGLLSRDGMASVLIEEWGVSQAAFVYAHPSELYGLIQKEIIAERPLILGTRSINSYGHYMVVTGYMGHDYEEASILLNDPYGLWKQHDDWCAECSGQAVPQKFSTFLANQERDGIFIIQP